MRRGGAGAACAVSLRDSSPSVVSAARVSIRTTRVVVCRPAAGRSPRNVAYRPA